MTSAADFLPEKITLPSLQSAARHCHGCGLYRRATQTVFGEGTPSSKLILIGEQPGDKEDRAGRPFVGPAGSLLDKALDEAGIERNDAYVTNAVKHFKWEWRGGRRFHKKPSEREIDACTPWLLAEITTLQPQAVVCMGATAARAAFGHAVRLADHRSEFSESRLSPHTFITIHPSAILRLHGRPEWHDDYLREYARFVRELRKVREYLH